VGDLAHRRAAGGPRRRHARGGRDADLAATAAEALLVAAAFGWRAPARVPRRLIPVATAALLAAGLGLVVHTR
jgi:hypothetical protein